MTWSAVPRLGRTIARGVAVLFLLVPVSVGPLRGQSATRLLDRDARLPGGGQLWLQVAPSFESWSEQYALDSPLAAEGQREPLHAHFDGTIAQRLFPGLDPLLALVNADAPALGFDSLTASDVSLGALTVGATDVDVRTVPIAVQFGIFDRLAIDLVAPLRRAKVEPTFVFDSASANLVRAEAALPATFLTDLAAARSQLQALVDGGTLTPEDLAVAQQLLDDTGAFSAALTARTSGEGYLFTPGSTPGQQMSARYGQYLSGLAAFGITAPTLSLTGTATRADFDAYFRRAPVAGEPPGPAVRGWSLGEIDVGLRVALLDTFEKQEPLPPTGADVETGPAAATDTVPAAAGRPSPPHGTGGGGIRFRTSVGARLRIPLSGPDEEPFSVPEVFLQQPIGDGQRDLELELWQDVQFGSRVLLAAGARIGIQQSDELVRRIAAPDRPYAQSDQQVTVERDLGDYVEIRASPRLLLGDALQVGFEYTYWRKQADAYSVVSGGVTSAEALALETEETRHGIGIGVYYRTTALHALGQASVPIDIAFVYQSAVAGSGGRTPVSQIVSTSLRVPVRLF